MSSFMVQGVVPRLSPLGHTHTHCSFFSQHIGSDSYEQEMSHTAPFSELAFNTSPATLQRGEPYINSHLQWGLNVLQQMQ